jgi:adenine specific DNA methylase Mod
MVELIWDGKYDATGKRTAPVRIALAFQTVETVNESAQQRQRTLDLFSAGRDPEWRNRLIWGDKKYVLPALLPEFAGKVDLVYIDPPFATGADFSFQTSVGEETFEKEPSMLEQKAYRDTWGRGFDGYIQWFYETAVVLHELLSQTGTLYVHCDWHMTSYIRLVLEEIFGRENFDAEIIWKRKDAQSSVETYGIIHDTILFFRKSSDFTFNKQFVDLSEATADTWYTNEELVEQDTINRKGQLIAVGSMRRYN